MSDKINKNQKKKLLFFFLFFFISIILLLFINKPFLSLFSLDGDISIKYETIIKRFQFMISTSIFIIIGFSGFYYFKLKSGIIFSNEKNNLFISIFSLILFVCYFEGALRLIPTNSSEDLLHKSIQYQPSSFSMHRLKPDQNVLKNNWEKKLEIKNGFRGSEFSIIKPKDEIRIIIIGGSFVFNNNQDLEYDWPSLVEEYMHNSGYKNIRVINAGVPGHRSFDAIGRLISELHLLSPDYVILCNAWNDIKYFHYLSAMDMPVNNILPLTHATSDLYDKKNFFSKGIDKLQIYHRINSLFNMIRKDPLKIENEIINQVNYEDNRITNQAKRQYKLNLETFINICNSIGAVAILMTQPRLIHESNHENIKPHVGTDIAKLNYNELLKAFNLCDEIIYDLTNNYTAKLIDIAPKYSGIKNYFSDHIHLSKNIGANQIAIGVGEELKLILESN